MVSRKVTIKNPTGLHLRPAGILCKEAMQFCILYSFFIYDPFLKIIHVSFLPVERRSHPASI